MKKSALTTWLPLLLVACTTTNQTQTPQTATTSTVFAIPQKLQFDPTHYKTLDILIDDETIKVRAFENIIYVNNPVDIEHQTMNIYIPESYFLGGTINGYTADTAPIFVPNAIGGYMSAKPMTPIRNENNQANSLIIALSKGYVVASPGARGRTLKNQFKESIGKAPASIIDLKASIRYLKANDKTMMGRADRIIVNGTSAGGAMTALLGTTGNHHDYEAELGKLGALTASDHVFAVSSYAPITNLDNADMAYEWQFNGINDYKAMKITMLDHNIKRELLDSALDEKEKILSTQLKLNFPSYINTLKLKGHTGQLLTLDNDGNGNFKDEVIYYLNKSINTAFQKGIDLSSYKFLTQSKSTEPYHINNYQDYLGHYLGRGKGVPAFDGTNLERGENNLFGDNATENRHFTSFSQQNNADNNAKIADIQTIKMMNPMNYIYDSQATITQHWRIRHGAKDNDTGLAIPVILATALQNQGKSVDFAFVWEQGHGGDYDLNELFDWADKKVKWAQ